MKFNLVDKLLIIAEELVKWKGKIDELKSEVDGWDLAYFGEVAKEVKRVVKDCLDLLLLDVAGLIIMGKHIKEVTRSLSKIKVTKNEKLMKIIEAIVETYKANQDKSREQLALAIASQVEKIGRR